MRNFGRILIVIVAVSLKLHKHLLHSIKVKLRFGTHHPITLRFFTGWLVVLYIQFSFIHTIIVDFCSNTFFLSSFILAMICFFIFISFFWTFTSVLLWRTENLVLLHNFCKINMNKDIYCSVLEFIIIKGVEGDHYFTYT